MLEFDGQTYALDIYLERLRRDLPLVAEIQASTRTPSARRNVGLGILHELMRSRFDGRGGWEAWDFDDWPLLRARSRPWYMGPHDLWLPVAPSLSARLSVTGDLLASWHFDEVAPEVLIEECHTAAELLLDVGLPRRSRRRSFADMIDEAETAGLLRSGQAIPDTNLTQAELLTALKDVRKELRHRNRGDGTAWLKDHFWAVAATLDWLTYTVGEAVGENEKRQRREARRAARA